MKAERLKQLVQKQAELQAHFTKPRLLSERKCWCGQSGDCIHAPTKGELVMSVPSDLPNEDGRVVAVFNEYNSKGEYLGRWALTQEDIDKKFQDYLLSRLWK